MDKTQGLIFSSAPHLKDNMTVSTAMRDVFLALLPVTLVAIYFFKAYAVVLIAVCLLTAAATETVFRLGMKKSPSLQDGSALLTGLFVALLMPPTAAWWTAAFATFIAVGIAKELMGGLGWNLFNPALFGRVSIIILAPFLPFLNTSSLPWAIDVVSTATPLAMLKQGMAMPGYGELLMAFPGGSLSETSALALLIGGAYLLYKKHINWQTPTTILATVFVLTLVAGQNPIYHLLSGGLLLGAFFMATDWVTSPITEKGEVIFGIAIGVLIFLFRVVLPPTEGVAFAILIMNPFVPLIDSMTRRPSFSEPRMIAPGIKAQKSVKS